MIKIQKYKFTLLILLILSIRNMSYGQDPIYSQFYNAHLQLNPALAGNTHSALIQMNYRNQWPALPQAYSTYSVSYDQYFKKLNSGFGVVVQADNAGAGTLKTTGISGVYSYKFKIKDQTYIKGGLDVGIHQLALDWSKLTFGDGIDRFNGPLSPGGVPLPSKEQNTGNNSSTYVTFGSGIVLSDPQYYVGFGLKNMNQPEFNFLNRDIASDGSFIPFRLSMQAGSKIVFVKDNKNRQATFLSPNVMYQRQAGYYQVNLGAYMSIDKVQFGGWYRHSGLTGDAIIGTVGFSKDFFKVGIRLNFDHIYPDKPDYNDCFAIFR
jgi:type IX secretion system PorP/SprF family membrane protein